MFGIDVTEREYRCLGQWEEDGLMYTYTQRRDVGTYECFVGSIISNNEIHIKEAGDHCQRNIDPMHYGMKLLRKGMYLESVMHKSLMCFRACLVFIPSSYCFTYHYYFAGCYTYV
jgi:hypothetical protein